MPLRIALKPRERFIINGCLLENGPAPAAVVVYNRAAILRERELMAPEAAQTPATRLYVALLALYLAPADDERRKALLTRLSEGFAALAGAEAAALLTRIARLVAGQQLYQALRPARALIAAEGASPA